MQRTRLPFWVLCGVLATGCSAAAELEGETGGGDEDDEGGGGGSRPNGGGGGRSDTGNDPDDTPDSESVPDSADPEDAGTDGSAVAQPDTVEVDATGTPDTAPATDTVATPDTPLDPFNCGEINAEAEPVPAVIDLMFVIDTSGSMDEEIEQIETNLNALATFVASSGLDIRVIMMGAQEAICPPAPLTDGSCPPTDTANYKVVNVVVGSNDSLALLRDNHTAGANYSQHFRPRSVRHVVFVTDDEATDLNASRYTTWAQGLPAPNMWDNLYYHAIVSLEETESCFLFICETNGCSGSYGDAEAEGGEYRRLVADTGGVESSICDADWAAILNGIAARIVETSQLPCTYGVPESTRPGEAIDPDTIRVEYRNGGTSTPIAPVASVDACGPAGGWYWEEPAVQDTIELCLTSCEATTGSVSVIGECRKQ